MVHGRFPSHAFPIAFGDEAEDLKIRKLTNECENPVQTT
jgi:hypothetical protein